MTTTVMLMLGKVTLVLAAGLAGVHLARRSRAAVRHLMLAAAFVVALAVPAISMLVPAVDIALLPTTSPAAAKPADVVVSEAARRESAVSGQAGKSTSPAAPASALTAPPVIVLVWAAG